MRNKLASPLSLTLSLVFILLLTIPLFALTTQQNPPSTPDYLEKIESQPVREFLERVEKHVHIYTITPHPPIPDIQNQSTLEKQIQAALQYLEEHTEEDDSWADALKIIESVLANITHVKSAWETGEAVDSGLLERFIESANQFIKKDQRPVPITTIESVEDWGESRRIAIDAETSNEILKRYFDADDFSDESERQFQEEQESAFQQKLIREIPVVDSLERAADAKRLIKNLAHTIVIDVDRLMEDYASITGDNSEKGMLRLISLLLDDLRPEFYHASKTEPADYTIKLKFERYSDGLMDLAQIYIVNELLIPQDKIPLATVGIAKSQAFTDRFEHLFYLVHRVIWETKKNVSFLHGTNWPYHEMQTLKELEGYINTITTTMRSDSDIVSPEMALTLFEYMFNRIGNFDTTNFKPEAENFIELVRAILTPAIEEARQLIVEKTLSYATEQSQKEAQSILQAA